MLHQNITSDSTKQSANMVNEWLTVLSDARDAGLVNSDRAGRINVHAALGLAVGEALADAICGALSDGPAAEMALDAIAPAYALGDVIELRALDPSGGGALSLSGAPDNPKQRTALKGFIRSHIGRRNLYVGVNPRRVDLAGTTTPARAADVVARRAVVLDLDNKDAPDNDTEWTRTIAELTSATAPLLVLQTGNGVHVWLATDTVSGANLSASVAPLAASMSRLGAHGMADLPRIVRLPYTPNLPTEAKMKRGATVKLTVPMSRNRAKTQGEAAPSMDALCATLNDMAASLGLPGRGGRSRNQAGVSRGGQW